MSLSKKQQAFVEHYLTCWNAAKAARHAGYSERSARSIGAENLTKPDIQAAIAARLADLHMTADEALVRLTARGRASMADVLALPTVDNPASWRLDLIKAQQTGAIHQVKKLKSGKYGDEIELYDPLPAIELWMKRLKLLGDDGGILKHIDLTQLSPEQLQRLADGDDPLAVLLDNPIAGAGGAGAAPAGPATPDDDNQLAAAAGAADAGAAQPG